MLTFWVVCFAASFLNKAIREDVWYKYNMGHFVELAVYVFATLVFAPYFAIGWILSQVGHFRNIPRI